MSRHHWRDSKGVCWARAETQALYDGEDLVLQLDSHHRFAHEWDRLLIEQLEACDADKPILSTFPGAYDPETEKLLHDLPMKILPSSFSNYGLLQTYPVGFFPKDHAAPIAARFLAAGFLFTLGSFCEDCRYDPQIYFAGEEFSLALRAYTHGYDFFHPTRAIVWHEYTRKDQPKHWSDHSTTPNARTLIDDKRRADGRRFEALLQSQADPNSLPAEYALGKERTIHDYERFAGVNVRDNLIHRKTRLGYGPETQSEHVWQQEDELARDDASQPRQWSFHVELPDEFSLQNTLTLISFFDQHNQLLERRQFSQSGDVEIVSERMNLNSLTPPTSWIISALDRTKGWVSIASGKVHDYLLLGA